MIENEDSLPSCQLEPCDCHPAVVPNNEKDLLPRVWTTAYPDLALLASY